MIFGFNMRLGRLHYFVATLVLAGVMTFIVFTIAGYVYRHTPKGADPTANLIGLPVIAATILFLWVTFNLQAMRIRDIGWNPVLIIPVWIALIVADGFAAVAVPSLSSGTGEHQTMVGAVINLAAICALLFWPSGDGSMPAPHEPKPAKSEPPAARRVAPSRPVSYGSPDRTSFGRRGL